MDYGERSFNYIMNYIIVGGNLRLGGMKRWDHALQYKNLPGIRVEKGSRHELYLYPDKLPLWLWLELLQGVKLMAPLQTRVRLV